MKLKESLRIDQRKGELSDTSARIALEIARSYVTKMQLAKGWPWVLVDDAVGDFGRRFVNCWTRIDPERNPRGYVMRMASSCAYTLLRKHDVIRRRDEKIEKINEGIIPTVAPRCESGSVLGRIGVPNGNYVSLRIRRMIRLEGMRMVEAGVNKSAVARALGVSRWTVQRWTN